MPSANQESKMPGHSQSLFLWSRIPGASVKWESSKDHHSIQTWHTVASSDKGQNPHFGLHQSGALSPARL